MEDEPILHVWIHTDNDLVDLTLTTKLHAPHSTVTTTASETIHTNKKHPFFTEEQGFVPVAQLKIGMHVLRADGRYGVVTGYKVVLGAKVMYNLEVAQDHTFTVGVGQWVVHNCNRPALRTATGAGSNEQAHHIIPCACENDATVQAAIGQGFDFDGTSNGVPLSTDPTVAATRGEVSHLGSHPVYTSFIQDRLNYWSANAPTALDAANYTVQDGLNYMANLAAMFPGIRLF